MKIIKEAQAQEWETDAEKILKRKIIQLLKADAQGRHFAKFAARLQDFLLKVVSREDDPELTAKVQWEEPETIYVSEGFVTNDAVIFNQLSVIIRHELAHNLLCHEIRMMRRITDKYGDKFAKHFKMSNSFHNLLNIIEDFEISNRVYDTKDKTTIKYLILNGEIIHGLVTEEHRDWDKMKLEEMYDALETEIENLNASILAKFDMLDLDDNNFRQSDDYLTRQISGGFNSYRQINHPTNFFSTLDKYLENKSHYHFALYDSPRGICMVKYSSLPEFYQEIIQQIAKEFTTANNYTKQELRDLVKELAKSDTMAKFDLKCKNGETIEIYTPEEKFLAIDCLKAVIPTLEEYQTWYDKVQKVLSDQKYAGELQHIFDEVSK